MIEIALEAGFEAHEAFTRAFSSQFGVSPSDYRRPHARVTARAPVSPPPSFARVETREPTERRLRVATRARISSARAGLGPPAAFSRGS
ncbi:helix-turn-helix domain-containing protein [Sorangium sp. So ce233]|uniref:helix-turn-helix domain-containing protein n=1 Tax=Sorangium sp. So ce233 TaxID=3133290 RepID=UPI003F5FEA65